MSAWQDVNIYTWFVYSSFVYRLFNFSVLLHTLLWRDMGRQYYISEWCVYNAEGPRTNNHVEGWHNKINRLAEKSHPNSYELVDLFKTEQVATEVTLSQLEAWRVLALTRKAYRTKEKRLKTIQQKFTNDECSLEYVTALSYWVGFRS